MNTWAMFAPMALATLIAPLLPVIMNSIPGWMQKYSEWSSSSSQKLKLKNDLYDKLKKRFQM